MTYLAVLKFRHDDYHDETSTYFTHIVTKNNEGDFNVECEKIIRSKVNTVDGLFGITHSKTVLVSDKRYKAEQI